MNENILPGFKELRSAYGGLADHPATTIVGATREAAAVLKYLRGFGATVRTVGDLHDAINALADEEELAAFRCREGIAVSHASDGWWLLFVDEPRDPETSDQVEHGRERQR